MRKLAPPIFALFTLAVGCQLFVSADRDKIHAGTGGSGGAPATTGGSGGAAPIPCLSPADCPGLDTDCRARTCDAGACGWKDMPDGTPTSVQAKADCQARVCDGKGGVKMVADAADTLDDGDPCTTDTCAAGAPRNEPQKAGTPCGDGRVCDDKGSCVACVAAAQCGGLTCVNNLCVPASCVDQTKNGAETAEDCGGPACVPCADGKACLVGADCASGVCGGAPRACLPPTCGDAIRNGAETDVDCGGSCAKRCAPGARCLADADCLGGKCSGSVCLPSCSDGVRNGAETGLDCGGACPPCATGEGCLFDADCAEGLCRAGLCVPATCADGVKDGLETDADCGGLCTPCAPGKTCAQGGDCTSHVCAGTLCSTASCADHTRNGGETGVDCGGPGCGKCPDGQPCAGAGDCTSGICLGGTCAAPGCMDGVKDLAETDVDCGGGSCPGCAGGRACVSGADCASTVCNAGVCSTPTCSDGLRNQGETDVDCGGPCPSCPLGEGCLGPADCVSVACGGGECVLPTCSDVVKNGQETGVDCGGPTCAKCAGGQGCLLPGDCASGMCTAGICEASCTDGLKDGAETAVDCGGPCNGCAPGLPCLVDGDCQSKICAGGTCAQPSCTDGVKNGAESDVDCGGAGCAPCGNGKTCASDGDCQSRGCFTKQCGDKLVLSELRTRGAGGPDDDFIELYNPGSLPVVVNGTWTIGHQSAMNGCNAPITLYTGAGQTVPPHRHLLVVGTAYAQDPPGDGTFATTPLDDTGSVWISHGGKTVDAICYSYDAISAATITTNCNIKFICEGMQANNQPHDGTKSATSTVDASLERKPGGAGGDGVDTDNSGADFQLKIPSDPQNLMSPAVP